MLIRLVYFKKIYMRRAKYHMMRSVCRSLEILLFFVISVVGFSLFAKTTSFNSKAKVKSLSGSPVAPRELSVPDISLHCDLNHLYSFFISPHQERTSSLSDDSGDHAFIGMPMLHRLSLPYCSSKQKNHPILSPLYKPGNLFQQNPVLLI